MINLLFFTFLDSLATMSFLCPRFIWMTIKVKNTSPCHFYSIVIWFYYFPSESHYETRKSRLRKLAEASNSAIHEVLRFQLHQPWGCCEETWETKSGAARTIYLQVCLQLYLVFTFHYIDCFLLFFVLPVLYMSSFDLYPFIKTFLKHFWR